MPGIMKSTITVEKVARYVVEQIVIESEIEARLRAETRKLSNAGMISSADVGALLAILAQSVLTKRALEIGTFTGYTALKIAQALPPDGQIICCDINDEWPSIGRKFWDEAGVTERIDLRLAPAAETLKALLHEGRAREFDFAFIDADKLGYDSYYEFCLQLVRPGGLIVLDNMLWDGRVADAPLNDPTTAALNALNLKISRDPRVDACLMTVGDGLMLARVRSRT